MWHCKAHFKITQFQTENHLFFLQCRQALDIGRIALYREYGVTYDADEGPLARRGLCFHKFPFEIIIITVGMDYHLCLAQACAVDKGCVVPLI